MKNPPQGRILGPFDSREAWLEQRRYGIGGSDAACILGLSSFTSPLEVFYSKVDTSEVPVTDSGNEAMRLGRELEPFVVEQWQRLNPLLEVDTSLVMIQSTEFPFLRHSPDGLIVEDGVPVAGLEVKVVRSDREWDPLPPVYMAQVQHGMLCSGLDTWHVVAMVSGQRIITRIIEADREMQGAIARRSERFWTEHVKLGIPPDADGSESASRALQAHFADTESERAIVTTDLWETYLEACEHAEVAAAEKKMAQQAIQQVMGHAEIATVDGTEVATWRTSTRTTVDAKELRHQFPSIADKVTKTSTTRVFRTK